MGRRPELIRYMDEYERKIFLTIFFTIQNEPHGARANQGENH
jgi:hypothetical protein